MSWSPRALSVALLLVLGAAGCAPGGPAGQSSARSPSQVDNQSRVKRVTAAMMGEPTAMVDRFNATQITVPGGRVLEMLSNAALTELSADGRLQPLLGEAVPSLENGLWKLLPDGRMETTWRISTRPTRPSCAARWAPPWHR